MRRAGPESDDLACENWRQMWLDNGVPESAVLEDHAERTRRFIQNARDDLGYATFIAVDDTTGHVIGSVCCQEWAGPMPTGLSDDDQKIGTVWAVYVNPEHRRRGVATAMMQRVKDHWESLGCTKGVLLHASDAGRKVYQKVGFEEGNMLTLDVASHTPPELSLPEGISISDQAADEAVCEHLVLARAESSLGELDQHGHQRVLQFLKDSQHSCQSVTFSARLPDGRIVGTVVSSLWSGPLPLVLQPEALRFGTAWGLYVQPEWRHCGIGRALMERCASHWQQLACHKGVVLCTPAGVRLLSQMGFEPGNALVLPLCGATDSASARVVGLLRKRLGNGHSSSDRQLKLMLNALPHQLQVAQEAGCLSPEEHQQVRAVQHEQCLVVRERDNWFSRNVARFGAGFDMAALSAQPEQLAAKFDRLAGKYDHWVVGNQSRVERWLAETCLARCASQGSERVVADVACGVGLPGHTLRLCGFEGRVVGCDISQGMVRRTLARGAYDDAVVANANDGLPWLDSSADVVICTGAMELLNQPVVLKEASRVLNPTGELWVSFQWDRENGDNPTAHQHVSGRTVHAVESELHRAGFEVVSLDKCEQAFLTPSPLKNGELLPVPYLFIVATRRGRDAPPAASA